MLPTFSRRLWGRIVVPALALLLLPAAAAAQPYAYTLTDLGVTGVYDISRGAAISNTGIVAGTLGLTSDSLNQRAFRWQNGVMTDLGIPTGGYLTQGTGVNSAGVVVGNTLLELVPGDPTSVAFRGFYHNGTLNLIPPDGTGDNTNAAAINSNGLVTGSTNNIQFGASQGYTYDSGSNSYVAILPTFPSGTNSAGSAISDTEYVVGRADVQTASAQPQRAFRWQTGDASLTSIPLLPGLPSQNPDFFNSSGLGVNEVGNTVGEADVSEGTFTGPGQSRPFFWDGTNVIDLGLLDVVNDTNGAAYDINNFDQIVGQTFQFSQVFGNINQKAFLFNYSGNPGSPGTMVNLNDLIDPVLYAGWDLQIATSINDDGWIVGTGIDPNGNTHAFLLRPNVIPEPATLLLGGLATSGLFGIWRRRRLAALHAAKAAAGFNAAA